MVLWSERLSSFATSHLVSLSAKLLDARVMSIFEWPCEPTKVFSEPLLIMLSLYLRMKSSRALPLVLVLSELVRVVWAFESIPITRSKFLLRAMLMAASSLAGGLSSFMSQ